MLLQNQVVVVSGASRGIGRTAALRLAAEGARVALLARNQAHLDTLAEEIAAAGGTASVHPVDVTDDAGVSDVFASIHGAWGPADLVVANAGLLTHVGPTWEADPEDWWREIEVNVRGSFTMARAALPPMIEAGRGRLVLFGGGGSTRAFPYATGYATAKAAVVRLAEQIDLELEGTGVRTFSVSPGFVKTDMTSPFATTEAGRKYIGFLAERLDRGEWTPPEACADLLVQIGTGALDALHGRFLHADLDRERLEELRGRAEEIVANEERILGMKGFSL